MRDLRKVSEKNISKSNGRMSDGNYVKSSDFDEFMICGIVGMFAGWLLFIALVN